MKSIAVTSGKGGTGKSCVAAYTAMALAKSGKKTLLLELGADFRSLDLIINAQEQVVFDLSDVLAGRCEPEKAMVRAGIQENLHLLPAGPEPDRSLNAGALRSLLTAVEKAYEYVLLDGVDFRVCPPGIFDTVIQVCTPDSLSVRSCAHQARTLYARGAGELRLIINNVPPRVQPIYGAEDFDDVIDIIGVRLLGIVPASPSLQYSANNARALDADSITGKIFDSVAGRLLGKRMPLLIR